MKYLNGILCLEGFEFVKTEDNPAGLVPKGTYDSLKARNNITVHGRAARGSSVLIEFENLPDVYKRLVFAKYGDPYEYVAKQPIRDLIKPDVAAIDFFARHRLPDGRPIKPEHQVQYSNDAAILNAFIELLADKRRLKQRLNISLEQFWQTACTIIKEVSDRYPNTLPTSERRLKPRFKDYKKDGYATLISGKYCNENNKKVDDNLERLILSLYIQQNKPYAKEVREMYMRFLVGDLEIVDINSGELFDRELFYKNNKPLVISDTTVYNYINKPINSITVGKFRTGGLEYSSTHKPHAHRHAPVYSFSKITMDDISIPFKMPDGTRVWSYQIMDVASGCIVGVSFGKEKNRGLFTQSVMDMFRLIGNKGWGMPAEIEVEQHISNTFADDLLKEGSVFPFVRFCRGGNPQEKRAENFIKGKKYGLQSKREGFQRRPFAKLEANRMNEDQDKVRYSFDEIMANERQDIATWNNSLHPNQDKYPGLTRWQVLADCQNPQLIQPEASTLARYVGFQVSTSVRRSQYVTVKHGKYGLPSSQFITRLHDLSVNAYYIPDSNGEINEVHLFQNGEFICTCSKLQTFNESRAERTAEDESIMHGQFQYLKEYDTMIREKVKGLSRVKAHENKPTLTAPVEVLPAPVTGPRIDDLQEESADEGTAFNTEYWERKAKEDL